jgi:hypothetical protein
MSMRTLLPITSATMLLMLGAGPAAHADAAMEACIDAFVAEHVPKDRKLKIRRVGPFNTSATREERITLTAKGARSGTPLAAATCIVSGDGSSVTLQAGSPTTVAAIAR